MPKFNAFELYPNKYMVDGKMIAFLMLVSVYLLVVLRKPVFSVIFLLEYPW